MGLVINEKKTKIMSNSNDQDYLVDELRIETVVDFKYLGQIISFSNRQSKEIDARISAAWRSFWSLKRFLLSSLPMHHKRILMDSVIIPTLTYGCQTWNISADDEKKFKFNKERWKGKFSV